MTAEEDSEELIALGHELGTRLVRSQMKVTITAVTVIFSALGLTAVLKFFGVTMLPSNASTIVYVRLAVMAIALLNLCAWIYFPLADLEVLRLWVRTTRKQFPAGTAEIMGMMSTMALLVGLVAGALAGPVWFGLVGIVAYSVNIVGFAYLKSNVIEAIDEARRLYQKAPVDRKRLYLNALTVVEQHWSTKPQHPFRGKQQVRLYWMEFGFVIATLLGTLSNTRGDGMAIASYLVGGITITVAEAVHLAWRIERDRKLHHIRMDLLAVQ